MAKWKITIKGLGKINNDVKQIDKSFEVDEATKRDLQNSSKRDAVLMGYLLIHYPGVEVDPKKVGLTITEVIDNSFLKNKVGTIGTAFVAGAIGGAIGGKIVNKKKNPPLKETSEPISFSENLQHIVYYVYNGTLEDTIQKLRSISIQTTGYRWVLNPDNQIQKENNQALSRCLKQYKFGLRRLKKQTDDEFLIKEFKSGLSKLRWKRFLNKYWVILLPFAFFLIMIILAIISES